jgi:hypothetical protein
MMHLGRATRAHLDLAEETQPAAAVSEKTGEGKDAKSAPDRAIEPPSAGAAPADQAVEPPPKAKESSETLSLDPEGGSPAAGDGGPIEARVAREQREAEALERARIWAEMRARDQKRQFSAAQAEFSSSTREPIAWGVWVARVALVLVVIGILGLAGGGGYYFLFTGDVRLTAGKAWEEFARDTPGATKTYRGKFVQITGKLKVVQVNKINHVLFEGPADAKWGIELVLRPDEVKTLKSGQELTVRCRFGTRKEPDGNLLLSNCTIVNSGAAPAS